jgi:hypothetical protein
VLTRAAEPVEVAHIYPFSMRNLKASTPADPLSIWTVLRQFWSQDRVDAWYKAVFPVGTEVVNNLMCLCPNAHKYHERASFALEPREISDDKKRLKVKFFWLPLYQQSSRVDLLHTPSIPEDLDQGPRGLKMWNVQTEKKICSGDEICLETNDPERLPLPDWRLLDMQWILHRVAAMSGAAEPRDDLDEDDDDWEVALGNEADLEMEDEWASYTSSPERSTLPSSPPPPCPLFFPSATTADQ